MSKMSNAKFESLNRILKILPQKSFLFSISVYTNICLCTHECSVCSSVWSRCILLPHVCCVTEHWALWHSGLSARLGSRPAPGLTSLQQTETHTQSRGRSVTSPSHRVSEKRPCDKFTFNLQNLTWFSQISSCFILSKWWNIKESF